MNPRFDTTDMSLLFRALKTTVRLFWRVGKLGLALAFLVGAVWVALSLASIGPGMVEEILGASETAVEEDMRIHVDEGGNIDLSSDVRQVVPACRERRVTAPDSDSDGLPDAWEEAGETPNGTALPDADPSRKDLYVQVNHGSNVEPLSETERASLREIWARMPVENPDGSTGVRIHLEHRGDRAGNLSTPVVLREAEGTRQYYTSEHLGDRKCVYRQVILGEIAPESSAGWGTSPGYAAAVEGRQTDGYEGNVSFRVAVTTHELLHNTAGQVSGEAHTPEGWLTAAPDPRDPDEYLSGATAQTFNATGIHGPAN